MTDTQEHLAKPNMVSIVDGQVIEFKPIYQHPFTGWEIVSVRDLSETEQRLNAERDAQLANRQAD